MRNFFPAFRVSRLKYETAVFVKKLRYSFHYSVPLILDVTLLRVL